MGGVVVVVVLLFGPFASFLSSSSDLLTANFKGFKDSYQLLWTLISRHLQWLIRYWFSGSACQRFLSIYLINLSQHPSIASL